MCLLHLLGIDHYGVCSVSTWQSFLNTNVVDAVKMLLQEGDFSRAAYVWTTSLVRLNAYTVFYVISYSARYIRNYGGLHYYNILKQINLSMLNRVYR